MKRTAGLVFAATAAAAVAAAHPHFNKTITATLPQGVELTITYNTTPANEMRAQAAKVGDFVSPRGPVLKLSGEVKTEKATVPAGEYTIGVIKNGDKDWTLALYPGRLARGQAPDVAKAIKLDSIFEGDKGMAEHMLIDVTPGHGRFEGKAVLTLHFGSLFLSGLLA
ncbi:MAG TPA: hypothetical protein VMT87_06935 [Vicinamibacteria bacterium]|nr:hypothetical protein [Vicinamibacteria bacterium]